MGADLYIRELYDTNYKKYSPLFDKWVEKRDRLTKEEASSKEIRKAKDKVDYYYEKMYSEGYFRDSYNATSLLWQYELSWWNVVSEELCNKDGELDEAGIKALLKLMDKDVFHENMAKLLNGHNDKMDHAADMDTMEHRKGWVAYFLKKDKEFRRFLRKALKLNVSIDCSL